MTKILRAGLGVVLGSFLLACGGAFAAVEPDASDPPSEDPVDPAPPEPPSTPATPRPPPSVACGVTPPAPAGNFAVDQFASLFAIAPVDVYAEHRPGPDGTQALLVAFSETPHECAYRTAGIVPRQMNELRLVLDRKSTSDVVAGTYGATPGELVVEGEAGQRCLTEAERSAPNVGFGGTAWAGGSLNGSLTLTAVTVESVTGSFDITLTDGQRMQGTFTAPICDAPTKQPAFCCGN